MRKMSLVQWHPLDRSFDVRTTEVTGRALMDKKREEAWQARQPCLHRVRVRSRVFPWRITELVAPVGQEGDAELLDLSGSPGYYHSNRTPRLTRRIRNTDSRETAFATVAHASRSKQQRSPLHPVVIAAELVAIGVLAMVGWAFVQSQDSLPSIMQGGPVF